MSRPVHLSFIPAASLLCADWPSYVGGIDFYVARLTALPEQAVGEVRHAPYIGFEPSPKRPKNIHVLRTRVASVRFAPLCSRCASYVCTKARQCGACFGARRIRKRPSEVLLTFLSVRAPEAFPNLGLFPKTLQREWRCARSFLREREGAQGFTSCPYSAARSLTWPRVHYSCGSRSRGLRK